MARSAVVGGGWEPKGGCVRCGGGCRALMSSVNEHRGWPRSSWLGGCGSVGLYRRGSIKKKRREGPGTGSGLLGPSGSLNELSAAWFCRVKLKTNKRK